MVGNSFDTNFSEIIDITVLGTVILYIVVYFSIDLVTVLLTSVMLTNANSDIA